MSGSDLPRLSEAAQSLLDTPPEVVFDRITQLATEFLGVPVSLLSVLDHDRQFFKSGVGLPEPYASLRETPLTHSFCQHVVNQGQALVVDNAPEHPLVQDNLAVTDLGVIAYAGHPVIDATGRPIAALCAIDGQPREWTPKDLEVLEVLAAQVSAEIAARQKLTQLGLDLQNMQQAAETRRQMARADRHDLRTPLGALSLNLQAIRDFGALNEDQAECLDHAEANIQEVLQLVDNLIDMGSVDDRGQQALDLALACMVVVAHAAIRQVQALALEKKQELQVDASPDLPSLMLDRDKVTRVLVNLLGNAIKFTPELGQIRLQVGPVKDGQMELRVQDTGIGMPPEVLEEIFEEGFRIDPGSGRMQRASGVGLAFCQRIITSHGGRIWAESQPGKGSVFHIILPMA